MARCGVAVLPFQLRMLLGDIEQVLPVLHSFPQPFPQEVLNACRVRGLGWQGHVTEAGNDGVTHATV